MEVGPIMQCCVIQFHAVDLLPFFVLVFKTCLCNSSYVNACNTCRNFGIGNEAGKFMVHLLLSINFAISFSTAVRQHRAYIMDHDNH